MINKFISSLMAVAMVTSVGISTAVQPAEAGGRNVGVGIAAGIIGLGILGAYANARDREHYRSSGGCYKGPEQCSWRDRHCFENRYGDYVCRGGVYRCYRPTICD
jgi:hypothetical protein